MIKKKQVKIELSFEEKQQAIIERQLNMFKEDYVNIPEPTYKFNIGEQVDVGSLEDVVIDKIMVNGKIYIVDYTSVKNNYGNPIRTPHSKQVFPWVNIRKQNNNEESFIENDDIRVNYTQRTISSLLNHNYHFGFDINPKYQRGLVWSLEDRVALIDSIFNNIEIGKFTFIKPDNIMEMNEVLDGKQRLTTILDFYEDRFKYKGKTFSDLSWIDRNHFKNYNISWGETENLTKEQKLRYFIKLNTTGKPMDESHINKVKNMLEECE